MSEAIRLRHPCRDCRHDSCGINPNYIKGFITMDRLRTSDEDGCDGLHKWERENNYNWRDYL